MKDVSEEVDSRLYAIPALNTYDWGNFPAQALGLFGDIHNRNASVALQLARYFCNIEKQRLTKKATNGVEISQPNGHLENSVLKIAKPFKLELEEALGLRLCRWPGRAQIVPKGQNLTYFLDGAHTLLSIQACRTWFEYVSRLQEETIGPIKTMKVLIFNTTKDREPKALLSHFSSYPFDKIIFSTNLTQSHSIKDTDNTNHTTSRFAQSKRCEEHKQAWEEIQKEKCINTRNLESCNENIAYKQNDNGSQIVPCCTAETINEAIEYATNSLINIDDLSKKNTLVQVLVTGSIHLVGGVLQIIDPKVLDRMENEEDEKITKEYKQMATEQNTR